MVISDNFYNVSTDTARIRMAQTALSTYDPSVKVTGTWDEISHRAFANFGSKAFYTDTNYVRAQNSAIVPNGPLYGVVITRGNWKTPVRNEEEREKAIDDFLSASYGQKPPGGWQYGVHFLFNGNGGVYNAKGMSSNPLFDRSKLTGGSATLCDALLETELYREGVRDLRFDISTGGISGVKAGGAQGGFTPAKPGGVQTFRGMLDANVGFEQLGYAAYSASGGAAGTQNAMNAGGSFAGNSIPQFLGYTSPHLGPQALSAYWSSGTDQLNSTGFASVAELEAWAQGRPSGGDTGSQVQQWIQQLIAMKLLDEPLDIWTQQCEDIVLRMLNRQSA